MLLQLEVYNIIQRRFLLGKAMNLLLFENKANSYKFEIRFSYKTYEIYSIKGNFHSYLIINVGKYKLYQIIDDKVEQEKALGYLVYVSLE